MPDAVLDELSYEKRAKFRREELEKNDPRFRTLVAEDKEAGIVGFVVAGPRREGNKKFGGEIYAIYLRREFQGKGIGKNLFLGAADWLCKQGYDSMLLWVLRDNPTRKFYEAMGGRELDSKIIKIGAPLVEISYGWESLSFSPLQK